jgi:hypothetical protein
MDPRDLFTLNRSEPVQSEPIRPSSSRTEPILPDDILNLRIDLERTQSVEEFLAVC